MSGSADSAVKYPAFGDAHLHLAALGRQARELKLHGQGYEAVLAAVAAAADAALDAAAPSITAGGWITGHGWDQNLWPGQQFPTKASLDAAISDRPVLLRRVDGHAIWVNSKALSAAGITKATPDPAGGKIVRDARGEPTGVMIDNAVDLVDGRIPPASAEVRKRRILDAQKLASPAKYANTRRPSWLCAAISS